MLWKEIIGGASLIGILGIIVGMQNKRIDKKMSSDVCSQRCKNTDASFGAIQQQQKECQALFKEMFTKISEQRDTLIEVKTILSIAAKKNGWQ